MAQVNPYLKFDGNCREAMNFYKNALNGELSLQTIGDSSAGAQMPAAGDSVMHAVLTKGALVIMGSDFHWGEGLSNGNSSQLCVQCDSENEIADYFTKLSEQATVTQPLSDMPWGAKFGSLIDKYGKYWIFSYDQSATS